MDILNKQKENDRTEKDKRYREKNKEKLKEYNKNYSQSEAGKETQKRSREKNKLKIKQYQINNKLKRNEYVNNYNKNKYHNDPLFKLKSNISSLIRKSFKKSGYKKNTRSNEIYGCSFEYLKEHIQNQFKLWMNWDNYGLYNGNFEYGWDIDHIEPLFPKGLERSEEDIIRLNHYSNLQPLCSKINRDIKKNNFE